MTSFDFLPPDMPPHYVNAMHLMLQTWPEFRYRYCGEHCGDCSLCCQLQNDYIPVALDRDQLNKLDIIVRNGGVLIRKHDDGRCVYLKDGKCSIHDGLQPLVCKEFNCAMYAALPLAIARDIARFEAFDMEAIYRQGQRVLDAIWRDSRKLFGRFERCRPTGATDIVDLLAVAEATGLTSAEVRFMQEHYHVLASRYNR